MKKYIDVDEVLQYLDAIYFIHTMEYHYLRNRISTAPTADVAEVKRAYWIKAICSEKDGDSNCSACNHFDWSDCKYCSECGAKMDGDKTVN